MFPTTKERKEMRKREMTFLQHNYVKSDADVYGDFFITFIITISVSSSLLQKRIVFLFFSILRICTVCVSF